MHRSIRALGFAAGFALTCGASRADEGMWTFDNFPAETMRAAHGWAPDQAWLDRAMAGTARLPSCSGAVVGGQGLVLTNQHCVVACLAQNSDLDRNLVRDGHFAATPAQEVRCPGMSLLTLEAIEDVTARIEVASEGVAREDFVAVRDAAIADIVAQCQRPGRACEVVALYDGGRYALHAYRRYDDVRLAFAPEYDVAQFGGGDDNFNFPRTSADFALLRLYAHGAPAATPFHLSLRFTAPEAGEIVLTAGNPGPTSRQKTLAELAFERDVAAPWRRAALGHARARLEAYAARGGDERRLAAEALENVANVADAYTGRQVALADRAGLARVAAAEADLQARVARNAAAQRVAGAAWDEIARAYEGYRSFHFAHQYLEARAGERSDLFAWARDIVRAADARAAPEATRPPRYSGSNVQRIERWVLSPRAVRPDWEEVNLAIWLAQLGDYVGAENAALAEAVLAGRTPDALAAELSASRLIDPAYRAALWSGGRTAVEASSDPMVAFVRRWDGAARALGARYEAEVAGPVARAHERIAQVRFRAFGARVYPEPTFSPRLSYGRVEGWAENGAAIGPFTSLRDLHARAEARGVALGARWAPARHSAIVVNLTASTDITSGNSGSALLDREGRVVGVVFDGNRASLGGEYYYDAARNRSISVSSQLIGAVLRLYQADALAEELAAPALAAAP